MITVSPATLLDVIHYHTHARIEDLLEVQVTTGKSLLKQSIKDLGDVQALYHEPSGHLLGIGGLEKETGRIWLLLTNHIYKHKMEFLRFSRKTLNELLLYFPSFYNVTLKKNHLHIDWLRWLGAEFECTEDPRFVKFTLSERK